MSERWKKRIVGVAALIVIAAALLPMLFDGSGYRERHVENRIPPEPESAQIIEAPEQAVTPAPLDVEPQTPAADSAVTAEVEADNSDVKEETAKPVTTAQDSSPRLDEQQVPESWTLQLASFRDEGNANALKAQLEKSGYTVYIREITDLYKVYVGPEVKRDTLEAIKAKLKDSYSLDGIIIRFTPRA